MSSAATTGGGAFGLGGLTRAIRRATSRKVPAGKARAAATKPLPRRALRAERLSLRERFRKGDLPRFLGLKLAVVFFGAVGVAGAHYGGHIAALREAPGNAFVMATRALGFGFAEFRLTGAVKLTPTEVLEAIRADGPTSLLAFDTAGARTRLLAHPLVKSATVRVHLPGTIAVTVTEREPVAIWQRAGQVNLVDRDGEVLGPYDDIRFSHLPLVVGEGAERRVSEIGDMLEPHPAIRSRVRAAVLVAQRRWTLKLADGVDIMLPEREPAGAVALLARLDRESALLNRDIAAVDLRLADRVVVRLTDRAAALRAEALRTRSRMPATAQPPRPLPAPQPAPRPGRVT